MTKVKDKIVRKHIHWRDVLIEIGEPELTARFWMKYQECKIGKKSIRSEDRIAYNVLKSWFGPRRMKYYRLVGSFY